MTDPTELNPDNDYEFGFSPGYKRRQMMLDQEEAIAEKRAEQYLALSQKDPTELTTGQAIQDALRRLLPAVGGYVAGRAVGTPTLSPHARFTVEDLDKLMTGGEVGAMQGIKAGQTAGDEYLANLRAVQEKRNAANLALANRQFNIADKRAEEENFLIKQGLQNQDTMERTKYQEEQAMRRLGVQEANINQRALNAQQANRAWTDPLIGEGLALQAQGLPIPEQNMRAIASDPKAHQQYLNTIEAKRALAGSNTVWTDPLVVSGIAKINDGKFDLLTPEEKNAVASNKAATEAYNKKQKNLTSAGAVESKAEMALGHQLLGEDQWEISPNKKITQQEASLLLSTKQATDTIDRTTRNIRSVIKEIGTMSKLRGITSKETESLGKKLQIVTQGINDIRSGMMTGDPAYKGTLSNQDMQRLDEIIPPKILTVRDLLNFNSKEIKDLLLNSDLRIGQLKEINNIAQEKFLSLQKNHSAFVKRSRQETPTANPTPMPTSTNIEDSPEFQKLFQEKLAKLKRGGTQ